MTSLSRALACGAVWLTVVMLPAARFLSPVAAEPAVESGDWPLHNLDVGNSRFSPLTGINTSNARDIALRWSLRLPPAEAPGSMTPIVAGGIMYFNVGSTLIAVDGATGERRWTRTLSPASEPGGRGPAIGDGVIYATADAYLFAIDARTGESLRSFGRQGAIDVARAALEIKDPGRYSSDFDPRTIGYAIKASPTYHGGTVYVGLAVADSLIPGGLIVALDGRTAKVKWVFRTVPQGPQDDGWDLTKDTWSGSARLGGGIWTQPAIDPALGLLYANVSNPSPNYDGSSRKGSNLFTDSIVALRLDTGKLAWYFQAIHHDIWDWDLMTGPTLFDTTIGGAPVKGVASLSKACYVYAFNRETGKPLFPIVETPVPTTTDMPGEQVWPTQPIPYSARHVQQQPLCATYPAIDDPELAKRRRPSYHPYQVNELVIVAPGLTGGPNRGSSSFSPRTGLLYVTGKNDAWSIRARPVGASLEPSATAQGHYAGFIEQGKTGVKASQNIAAYDPRTGELAWITEFAGTTNGGTLVTAGDVLFEAIGPTFHVLDARSGTRLADVPMDAFSGATPLTYLAAGRQFVALSAGGSILAYGLPK